MSKVYLVRHGDYEHKSGGLTSKGADQATSIGILLGKREKEYILMTSPYPRTVQTAQHIRNYIKCVAFIENQLLREYLGSEDWVRMEERASIALNMAYGVQKCDVIIVSHQAVLQIMVGEITGRDAKSIRIPKGTVYEIEVKTFVRIRDYTKLDKE